MHLAAEAERLKSYEITWMARQRYRPSTSPDSVELIEQSGCDVDVARPWDW
ncbi:hypothetical protein OG592_41190 (plasmid) [Streptomyces avidinii]|uniref:hypothetical protein n=1 Tax=Streptomyces avidinii TaxID=1895 RepID=UPI0038703607|nr:hypothetical protein OG592_41190 [Streptomyces avidinii]